MPRSIKHTNLYIVVDRLAALLHERDIHSGDFVAVFATNSPEMIVMLYALSKLGATAALININLRGMNALSFIASQSLANLDKSTRRHFHALSQRLGLQVYHIYTRSIKVCVL